MILQALLLILGFALLIKGGEWLVDGAAAIARRTGVSDLAIGLTVVSFGTSAPELVVSLLASVQGSPAITIGNVVGSNIANVFLILGAAALIHPMTAGRGTVWKEIPFTLLASVVFAIQVNDYLLGGRADSILSRGDGLVLLAFFVIFLYYVSQIMTEDSATLPEAPRDATPGKALLKAAAGLAALAAGGHFVVSSASAMALAWGVSEAMIGLTIVALGTSLPELAASTVAAFKRNADIAVGNVIGSNIFNILLVLGLSSAIFPIPFDISANIDVAVMLAATVMLFLVMFIGKPRRQIGRGEGAFFLLCYALYIAATVYRG